MRTKFSGILTLILALVVQLTFAQQKTITGTVTDDTGLPLPGANVLIKGTSSGTQSDFDGNFSISANVGQTLTFSYVGFSAKEVKVGAQNKINISLLPDAAALEEVVITGYSTRNQTVQTSAVVSISASEISELAPTTSIDNLLQGKAAGVQVTAANGKPGQGAFVRIRGTGSLSAGASSPLYIVDGATIREQELGQIANEDIENITILKDAATTARYGSRGANGVVVITTKNGNRNKEATVRFSSRYGVSSLIKPNFNVMNVEQKLQYEAELFALGLGSAAAPGVSTNPGSPERLKLIDESPDWQKLGYKEGVISSNTASISGGAEKIDYFFSVGNDKNTGIINNLNGFERTNSRLNINFDAKKWLSVGVNVGYSHATSDEPRDRNNSQNLFRFLYDVNPYERYYVYDADGNQVFNEYGNPLYNNTNTGFAGVGSILTEPATDSWNTFLASGDAQVKFTKNFSYSLRYSLNSVNRRRDSYSLPGGVLINLIGNPDFPGNKLDFESFRTDITISNNLNYTLSLNDHHLNVLGLYEYNINSYRDILARKIGFPTPILTTQVNAAQLNDANTSANKLALLSYGLFADYDYKEKYLASASARYDASSNFGKDNQYGLFYSFSAGWNIAKESFFNADFVDDLKIRGSYGTVGNRSGIDNYASQGTVSFSNPYPGGSSSTPDNIANPDLKWETTKTTDIGLEFNLFNNRVKGVADYFIRKTEDLLFPIPRADESGISTVAGNLGEIENKGLEISLQADVFRTADFTWTLGGNIIFLDTKILKLPEGKDVSPSDNTFNILYREGAKINEHYLVRYAGVDPANGRPQYYKADGTIVYADGINQDTDRVLQGKSTIANKEGGFFTNIRYKGFGLRTDFVFKAGNWINNFVESNLNSDGASVTDNQAVSAFNYWQQPGDTGVLPDPRTTLNNENNINSDRFLEKGDYIRMRNVTLSYTLPRQYMDKLPFTSFRIYVQGQNLLTFTDFYGDPEVGLSSAESISFAQTVAPGEATLYSYPNTKSIQLGLDVSF
ncbi:MAG: TonB-dependent receptor [Flavobacteriaceae bacterium]|nr:TonB-dependent receptor [Flavobacteriaceae bacterium]